jgi:heme-degrading monooxygenase HmoA
MKSMMKAVSLLTVFVALFGETRAFNLVAPLPGSSSAHRAVTSSGRLRLPLSLSMSTTEQDIETTSTSSSDTTKDVLLLPNGCHKRDRYIATNRFAVRPNQQAKFEKRWATRQSRLATLDGFKYFHLMRRVKRLPSSTMGSSCEYDGGYSDDDNSNNNNKSSSPEENYISFTVWNKKSDFSTWRKGDAFKEAHGGTSIGAFVSTIVNSAIILRGAPRPAFYDALFLQSNQTPQVTTVVIDGGWRKDVKADGIHILPAECFVSWQKYFIARDKAALFEKEWKEKDNLNKAQPGFVMRSLMRRDGQAKGHGIQELTANEPTYVVCTIFQDRESYETCMTAAAAAATSNTSRCSIDSSLYSREPEQVFYEGALVISSKDGAQTSKL